MLHFGRLSTRRLFVLIELTEGWYAEPAEVWYAEPAEVRFSFNYYDMGTCMNRNGAGGGRFYPALPDRAVLLRSLWAAQAGPLKPLRNNSLSIY